MPLQNSDITLLNDYLIVTAPKLTQHDREKLIANGLDHRRHNIHDLFENPNLSDAFNSTASQRELWSVITDLHQRANQEAPTTLLNRVAHKADLENVLHERFNGLDYEQVLVLGFYPQSRLIDVFEPNTGDQTGVIIDNRRIVKWALANNAAGVIIAHNHPRGTSDPSEADLASLTQLKAALALFDIQLVGSAVVAPTHINWL